MLCALGFAELHITQAMRALLAERVQAEGSGSSAPTTPRPQTAASPHSIRGAPKGLQLPLENIGGGADESE
jgi:hypothetical protein